MLLLLLLFCGNCDIHFEIHSLPFGSTNEGSNSMQRGSAKGRAASHGLVAVAPPCIAWRLLMLRRRRSVSASSLWRDTKCDLGVAPNLLLEKNRELGVAPILLLGKIKNWVSATSPAIASPGQARAPGFAVACAGIGRTDAASEAASGARVQVPAREAACGRPRFLHPL